MHFALLQFVLVAALILANGFFVAAEFALVSIRDSRVEQMIANSIPGARAVRLLQQDLDDFLPAVQLGVTLCSLALGWIGEPTLAAFFLAGINTLSFAIPHAVLYSNIAAVALAFAFITYFHVLLGELVPKSLALRRTDALAVAVAPSMLFFMAITRPIVHLLRSSALLVLKVFNVPVTERAAVHSAEELKLIATAARRVGVLPPYQESLIHRALELEEITVREIMTPRQKIISLPSNMLIEEASAEVIHHQHSRVPVYDETRGPEHIVGIVYSNDLARLMHFRPANAAKTDAGSSASGHLLISNYLSLSLSQIMRDVFVVPETKTVLDLIRDLQQRRRQLAIVVDEFGTTVGLVTVEDAVEQLTGELDDEFDDPAKPVITTASGALLMDGSVNLRDLETQMQWSLPREAGIDTLAGFLLLRLGHIPVAGESVLWEGRRMSIVEMDGRRIAKVRVEPTAAHKTQDEPVPADAR
jgi:putative hemolysin